MEAWQAAGPKDIVTAWWALCETEDANTRIRAAYAAAECEQPRIIALYFEGRGRSRKGDEQ